MIDSLPVQQFLLCQTWKSTKTWSLHTSQILQTSIMKFFLAPDLILVIQSNLFWLTLRPLPPESALKLPSKCWISCSVSRSLRLRSIDRKENIFVQEKCAPSCDERNKRFFSYKRANERRISNFFIEAILKCTFALKAIAFEIPAPTCCWGRAMWSEGRELILFFSRPKLHNSLRRTQLMMHQTHTAGKIASLNLRRKWFAFVAEIFKFFTIFTANCKIFHSRTRSESSNERFIAPTSSISIFYFMIAVAVHGIIYRFTFLFPFTTEAILFGNATAWTAGE